MPTTISIFWDENVTNAAYQFIGSDGELSGSPVVVGVSSRFWSKADVVIPAGALGHEWTANRMSDNSLVGPITQSYDLSLVSGVVDAFKAAFTQVLLATQYVPSAAPVVVAPSYLETEGLCVIYGGFKSSQGKLLADVEVTFELVTPEPLLSGGRLITREKFTLVTDKDGLITPVNVVKPPGNSWKITCTAAKFEKTFEITPEQTMIDLGTLTVP